MKKKLITDIHFSGMEDYWTPEEIAENFCNKLIAELEEIKKNIPLATKTETAMSLDNIITQLQS